MFFCSCVTTKPDVYVVTATTPSVSNLYMFELINEKGDVLVVMRSKSNWNIGEQVPIDSIYCNYDQ